MTSTTTPATVKMIAMLHGWCTAHGVATNQQVKVPNEGITATELAVSTRSFDQGAAGHSFPAAHPHRIPRSSASSARAVDAAACYFTVK